MKVLVVARCKENGYAPFITEQVEAVKQLGVECQFFPLKYKGLWGYLRLLPELNKAIRAFSPDIIHSHYGLSGVFANMQRRIPVVTTYHGSDINDKMVLKLSKISIRFSRFNIFVSQDNINTAMPKRNYALIPCGINLSDYEPVIEKKDARGIMGLAPDIKIVLFSGAFDNTIKNAPLAKEAVALVPDARLMELKGYTRNQVTTLMHAADCFLMTSFSEGSPQVIKEALACGCPIVSVDVGDVRNLINGINGCYIADWTPTDLAAKINMAFLSGRCTSGKDRLLQRGLANNQVAQKIHNIYTRLIYSEMDENSR